MSSLEPDWTPRRRFSHIYAERRALDHPLAREILRRLNGSVLVPIESYKHVFNRRRQNPRLQERSKKLILAVKRPPFLYHLSENCQTFGFSRSFYTTPMVNCLYDCDYCYLRGKTDTANIVLFVNVEDFLRAASALRHQTETADDPVQLNLSYDTDLLAFEKWTGLCARWLEHTRSTPGLITELRTKSAAYRRIRHLPPSDRFVLAWSLSPDLLARRFDRNAPTLGRRLAAAAQAAEDGWPLRLCFDPVLPVDNWRALYGEMFEQVFRIIDGERVQAVGAGPFRMGSGYFRKLRRSRPDCDLFYTDHAARKEAVAIDIRGMLSHYVPAERIAIWQ